MENCRFCGIVNNMGREQKVEDTIIAESDDYFAIASVGALVEGWILIVPKRHSCSMKHIYSDKNFELFTRDIAKALIDCYGPIIVFEHGPNREGSETSCGTDHAHIHLVPYHSIAANLEATNLDWKKCRTSEICGIVGDNEYLFYSEVSDFNNAWENPIGQVHILKTPVSQFFRRIIAKDQGNPEKFNYKVNPDSTLTIKTIARLQKYFNLCAGGQYGWK